MPNRPPHDWFRRCVAEVSAAGIAAAPASVCGATWQRKSEGEKRATVRMEETMAGKKKKKKPPHKATHRHKAKRPHKEKKHHRCAYCGHAAGHGAAGCTHVGHKGHFCPCKHTSARAA
jgi:hypothetical protein